MKQEGRDEVLTVGCIGEASRTAVPGPVERFTPPSRREWRSFCLDREAALAGVDLPCSVCPAVTALISDLVTR